MIYPEGQPASLDEILKPDTPSGIALLSRQTIRRCHTPSACVSFTLAFASFCSAVSIFVSGKLMIMTLQVLGADRGCLASNSPTNRTTHEQSKPWMVLG